MSKEVPPSYQDIKVHVSPTAPSVNEAFVPDEGASFEKTPTAPQWEQQERRERLPVENLPALTEDEIREVCLDYASQHCCYGSKFVKQAEFPEITNSCCFHYRLESFGEKRESSPRTESYRGGYVDGPENGPAPAPWDIQVNRPTYFVNSSYRCEIPHTAVVKTCSECVGIGRVRCSSCYGRGGESCWSCGGSGRSNDERCSSCNGTGHKQCWNCNGTGQESCGTCSGYGKLKSYRILIVTWTNHVDDFISNTYTLPKELIKAVSGRELFKEQNKKVYPITHAPDQVMNSASSTLIAKHERIHDSELILQQRQILRAVPLTRVKYQWKRKEGEFYAYGFQKAVFFEDYPQKCCCCTCL